MCSRKKQNPEEVNKVMVAISDKYNVLSNDNEEYPIKRRNILADESNQA